MAKKKAAPKARAKFSDPRVALKPKNFGECPVPTTQKARELAPKHHRHMEDFKANVLTGLNQVYRNFGPAHKKDANNYLKFCFRRVANLLK